MNIIHNARIIAKHNGLLSLRGLNIQPSFYTDGQVLMIMSTMISGGTVVQAKFNTRTFWKLVEDYMIEYCAVMPTNLAMLTYSGSQKRYNTESMKFILCSAAPLPYQLHKDFEEKFKIPVVDGYGLTEAGSYSTCNLPTPKEVLAAGVSDRWRKVGSVGKAIGNTLKIVDIKTGEELEAGKIGEILIKGDNVMKGYLNNPEDTINTLRDGWLHTGDLGMIDENGYCYIKGRIKDIIIHGGQKILARDVEQTLCMHPNVKLAAVIPVPDKIWDEQVKAIIVLKKPGLTSHEDIISFCKERLAGFKCPKIVQFVEDLPLSPSGKILKPKLKEIYGKAGDYEKTISRG
jgi:acyl-CoA synthetase (AMP-forming)/AMP-acid ligase II